MIELLGVGVPRPDGGWLLRRICATLDPGNVVVVAGPSEEERQALLDAIAGRAVPAEGRIWVSRVPVMKETLRRVRRLVADVAPSDPVDEPRSLFWNVLVPPDSARPLRRLLRLPGPAEPRAARAALERVGLGPRSHDAARELGAGERARLVVARALAVCARHLIVREPARWLHGDELAAFVTLLRRIAVEERACVIVSASSFEADGLAGSVDRALRLVDGVLVHDDRRDARARGRVAALTS